MEAVDLNIDNYDYEDILNLFCLTHDFGENGLKNAKKIVLATHPDKSGLNKEYFLFFSKAFKILNFVYTFREKTNSSEKKNINYENTEYLLNSENNDENNKEIINQLKEKKILNPQNFNKWFNELFEKVKINKDNIIHNISKKIINNVGFIRNNYSGNLIIKFNIDYPEKISKETREALKKIL